LLKAGRASKALTGMIEMGIFRDAMRCLLRRPAGFAVFTLVFSSCPAWRF
jgi:hypothetical protein